jgi:hypothetical protein
VVQKWFIGLALVLSALALSLSIWTHQQADARAQAALKRREKALVDKYRPEVERICREFKLKESPPPDADTLDQLLRPLGPLFQPVSK